MHKKDKKSEIEAKFKRFLKTSYMNVFLVFAMVLIAGVLFNAPANAQDQPQGFPGELGLPSQDNSVAGQSLNQAPNISSLESDKPGPQDAGSSIKWTAIAVDPENDPISYMFRLKGPSTGDVWLSVTQWTEDNTWKWNTASGDTGKYQISVWVRDPGHASPEFNPVEKIANYELTQPQAPAGVAPIAPVTNAEPNLPPANVPIQQAIQVPEPTAPPVETIAVNQPPTMDGLTPSPASPQVAGASVTFAATASDTESDPLQYMFLLDNQPKTSWTDNPAWTWTTAATDIGSHSIEVRAKDSKHNPDGDSSKAIDFVISAPPNNPPAVTNLATDLASPQVAGAAVTFTATASDSESDPLQYMFLLDGQPKTSWTDNPAWIWTTAATDIGSHSIEVRTKDSKHNPDGDSSKAIDFVISAPPNNPPAVTNLASNSASPKVAGAAVSFTAVASDTENDPLQYMFVLDGKPMTDWTDNPSWTWTTAATDIGSHSIEVRAKDSKHNPDGDGSKAIDFVISAPPNNPPAITNLATDLASPQVAGAAVTFTATASDSESDPLQYMFLLDGQPKTIWADNPAWTWTTAATDIGSHSIEVRAKDSKHNPDGDSSKAIDFVISAPPNNPPAVTNLATDPASPQVAGAAVTFTVTASDTESDPLQYMFLLDGQPKTSWADNPAWTWTTAATDIGSHSIEVRAKDSKHNPDGDSSKAIDFVISAPPNNPPAVTNLATDPASPQLLGTTVTWTAEAKDPESDPISYRFLVNDTLSSDWQPQNQFAWTATVPGTSQITVQAKDSRHDGPEGVNGNMSAEFTINAPAPIVAPVKAEIVPVVVAPVKLNESPSITGLEADKKSPQLLGTTVAWTASAKDPESDPISYRFLVNDTPNSEWQANDQFAWTATVPGTSQITVQAKDSQHEGPEGVNGNKSANFIITAPVPEVVPAKIEIKPEVVAPVKLNESPGITGLEADKKSPQLLGTTVAWTASAKDPESDPISYRFLVNDTPNSEWQANDQFAWTATVPGTSQITVQAKDSQHAGPEGVNGNKSAEFTINAPAPEIKPIEVAPATNGTAPAENKTVPVVITPETVTPPAAENITTPIVPKNVTEPTTANETKPAAPVAPVVVNQTPILNSLTPDIASPQKPGETITWTANATDADMDKLFFRFFLNGPATNGAWQSETDWGTDNTWTWKTSVADAGENQVKAQVRDGKHAAVDGFDSELSGYFTLSEPALNISGSAYEDKNSNGKMDSGEALVGWTIQLVKPDNSQVSVLTKDDGSYRFEQLKAGSYTVSESLPSGWTRTAPKEGSYSVDLKDSDAKGLDFANSKPTLYTISGMKFNDLNGNGVFDGEPGMEGWTIQLSGNAVNTTKTGKDGSYRFAGLAPGSYSVAEVEQSGWTRTAPKEGSYSLDLKDSDIAGKDFGNHGSFSISGTSFVDTNGNGVKDSDETGQAGRSLQLSLNGNVINATTTGKDGSYSFQNLAPGTYTISEIAQEGWAQTAPQGPYTVELKDASVTGKDFGSRGNLSISGQKYYDINGNGVQDADEPGIPGSAVSLVDNGKVVANTTTDDNGLYSFKNILPGTYTINDPVPGGLILTTSSSITVTVTTTVVVQANFGLVGLYSISGMKYNDLNGNKARDSGEPAVPGWDMVLTGTTWFGRNLTARTTTTAADGTYKFDKLLPGTYKVSETSRTGWTQMAPPAGSYSITFTFGGPKESKNNDFGNRVEAQTISGVKYNDLNGNSARDPGELGMNGWTINLEQPAGTVIQTKTTAADGSYSFTGLAPGTYVISEVQQTGWTQKAPAGGRYTVTLDATTTSAAGKDFGNFNNNFPPKDPTLSPDKISPRKAGTFIVWTAGATDPDGDALKFRFFVRGPGPNQDTGYSGNNVWTWDTAGKAAGTYQIEVWIRDGKHAGVNSFDVKKTVSFSLTSANLPPRVQVLFADRPAPEFAGSWIRWTAIGSDPEGDPLQYKFYLRGPSTSGFWMDQTGWGKNNRWIWRTNPTDVGYSQVLVAVRDGKHAGPGGSDDYDVANYFIINLNQPPVITGFGTSLGNAQPVGATIRWSATAFDPEGNPVFYRYWLKGPSTEGFWRLVRDWSTDPTWVWPTTFADAGTSEIQLQVRDGLHASPAGWDDDAGALFTVQRPNLPPTLISLGSDKPSSQTAGAPIRWIAKAADPDGGDRLLYRFWLKGPSTGNTWKIVQDWSTKNQWIWSSRPNDGGAYSVYVFVRDGLHNAATGYDSALGAPYVLVSNQPPRLTALASDRPTPTGAGGVVRWKATATDVNRDPIFYRFWLKGPSTGNAWMIVQDWSINNQWTWLNAPTDAGNYKIFVYVRDGKHAPLTGYDSAVGQDYTLVSLISKKVATLGRVR